MIRRELELVMLAAALAVTCHPGGGKYPWPPTDEQLPFEHAEVHTLNSDYARTRSEVLVRKIDSPTRAALDYAAYHANFMIADPAPEREDENAANVSPDVANPFGGLIEKSTLTSDRRKLPLSEPERLHPLAFAPLVEFLQAAHADGATELEELAARVREESWGFAAQPGIATQSISEVFVHGAGDSRELWAKIEFQPWFKGLGALPDQDRDGFPEVYGKVPSARVKQPALELIASEYSARVLSPAEVKGWANRLASYWYPSFNTDLVPAGSVWPDEHTEPEIKKQLGTRTYPNPTIVLRGKPQGKPTYQLFLVNSAAPGAGSTPAGGSGASHPKLATSRPTPDPGTVKKSIQKELAEHGGDFERWRKELAPAHATIRQHLRATPKPIQALAGSDGFLFFRKSLEFVTSGDLQRQKKGKNPLPVIVEFQKVLASHGVDFLFVPVPTKLELFPGELDPKLRALSGQVIAPFSRKFLLALSEAGVEVVDLLPAFLEAQAATNSTSSTSSTSSKGLEPLYQRQDTHWTDRGLRLAADRIGARIKKYPWFKELSAAARLFTTKEAKFQRFGDLHSRLPDAKKAGYRPEALLAQQVVGPDGALYEDDPESPLVVLGDSFTGVYELTDAEHAGVSAHIAKVVSYPVDLVMSYGGGPNVRNKLMRRGVEALDSKKLVIWIMTARDLYDYWENWEPLGGQ